VLADMMNVCRFVVFWDFGFLVFRIVSLVKSEKVVGFIKSKSKGESLSVLKQQGGHEGGAMVAVRLKLIRHH
jgi:hypothetical protein